MIRVTETTERKRRVLRVDGRLTADDVPILGKRDSELGRLYALDLSGLESVDAAGSEKLRELASCGVGIWGASPYIQLLIDGDD